MRRSSFLAKIPFCQTSFGTEAAFLLSAIIVLPLSSSVPIKKPFSLAKLYAYVPSLTFQRTFFEVMFLPISVTLAGIVISVIEVLLNALSPIFRTPSLITTFDKLLQSWNAAFPIYFTVPGIVISARSDEALNILELICLIPLPILTDVSDVQFWNADEPTYFTVSGISIFPRERQP